MKKNTIWLSQELKEKFARIRELEKNELNTPRMIYLQKNAPDDDFENALLWAKEIHKKDPKQIFNIRTYNRDGKYETINCPHITDIKYENLTKKLWETNADFVCMIDAETPDDGRWAGNILIKTDEHGHPSQYIIDYCVKNIRAMVRDADTTKTGSIRTLHDLGTPLSMIVSNALKFNKKDVILEWTLFKDGAGIKNEPLVFWEYRQFRS